MNASTIEEEALALPVQDRARLVEKLLGRLENLPEQDAETLWLDVAEHRAPGNRRRAGAVGDSDELERRIQVRLK